MLMPQAVASVVRNGLFVMKNASFWAAYDLADSLANVRCADQGATFSG